MKIKYVMFDGAFPVVFGEYIKHSDVSVKDLKPTSAGFIQLGMPGEITVYGKSESLDLAPTEDDDAIIKLALQI
jgi:hypothetical protein